MKKILLILTSLIILTNSVFATQKFDLNTVLKDFTINSDSVSISIKDINTGKSVYALNSNMLINPASVQKLLTTPAAIDTLGSDYKFMTGLYKKSNDNYLLKLSADPYFTSDDLKSLISPLQKTCQNVYIDDGVLDEKTWGEGWQWDDEMNILMPRFSSYNIDNNLAKIKIVAAADNYKTIIINDGGYPFLFFNNVTVDKTTKVNLQRNTAMAQNAIILNGTISRPTIKYIPVTDTKGYFKFQLTKLLEHKKIYMKTPCKPGCLQAQDTLVNSIEHNIDETIVDILHNSNNMAMETVFKLAGAKHCGIKTGTDISGIKMFNDYCNKLNLDSAKIKIVDGSGVSKNNLASADFITDFLVLHKDNEVLKSLPHPGEGTLLRRMLPLRDYVQAKTGTLADISSIAGYLTTRSGKQYAFCIITNDLKLSESDKKIMEDYLIKEAFLKL